MPLACVWMLLDVLGIFFSIKYHNKLAVSGTEKHDSNSILLEKSNGKLYRAVFGREWREFIREYDSSRKNVATINLIRYCNHITLKIAVLKFSGGK
jgi:hypothetical protein